MNWKTKDKKQLVDSILVLKTADETQRFLRDLMTEQEINEFSKRLQAAVMLTDEISYSTIEEKTGLSSTTIARVSKWLNGPLGGYKSVISKIHHHPLISVRRGLS